MYIFPLIIGLIIILSTLLELHDTAHESIFLLGVLSFHVSDWEAWALWSIVAIIIFTKYGSFSYHSETRVLVL